MKEHKFKKIYFVRKMSSNPRVLLHKKISQVLRNKKSQSDVVTKLLNLKYDKAKKKFLFALPLKSKLHDIYEDVANLAKDDSDAFLKDVEISQKKPELHFELDRDNYVKNLLESIQRKVVPPDYICEKPKNIVVDFSSPNIAKPFHVGHLRSTMIGNFISNINNYVNNSVKRINYLGDWGTQFGFVQLGLLLSKVSDETIKKDPIVTLYNAYVYANKLAEDDPNIADQAREIFRKLESGDNSNLAGWESFRKYTIEELHKTYNRIDVKFDEYEWESMYSMSKSKSIVLALEKLNLLNTDDQGRRVVSLSEKKHVPIVKSDGSSLYITRDLAAAFSRYERTKFDNMYYVVDNSQADHFMNLIGVLNAMEVHWANRLKHIKFGKVRGMSTRKGTAVFLKDFLDETKIIMREKQIQSPNTKVNLDYDDPSTEVLGVSAVIINDLRHKRHQDYEFSWDTALDIKGDSGVSIQYTHCRLVSLEENSGATVASECIPSLLTEPLAEDLLWTIGRFDEAVIRSYQELEPYTLVHYLFQLSHATSKALRVLQIKGEPTELANQRLLLMNSARKVLAQGMKLLGLRPLNKM